MFVDFSSKPLVPEITGVITKVCDVKFTSKQLHTQKKTTTELSYLLTQSRWTSPSKI